MSARVVLTGMPGAGKSAAGALLAARLGVPFLDLDRRIEEHAGRSIAAFLREEGEEAFRERESAALRDLLRGARSGVLAAGGGAVLSAANRRALSEWGTVVYLRAAPETLAARLGPEEIAARPLLDAADPAGSLRRILASRAPLYEEADHAIDIDRLTPEETARAAARRLSAPPPGGEPLDRPSQSP